MSISELDRVLIHKYIKGTLNNEDMKLFRTESKRKDFRKELLRNIRVLKNINDANKDELLNKFEYINLTNPEKELDTTTVDEISNLISSKMISKKRTNSKTLVFAMIFLFLISAIGTWVYTNMSATKDVKHYASLYIESTIINAEFGDRNRGGNSEVTDEVRLQFENKINTALKQKDYNLLVTDMSVYNSQITLTAEEKYIWAASLMKIGETEEAVDLFSEIISHKKEYFIESLWLRGVCYGSLNNNILMIKDLNEIKARTQYKSEKIETLLKITT